MLTRADPQIEKKGKPCQLHGMVLHCVCCKPAAPPQWVDISTLFILDSCPLFTVSLPYLPNDNSDCVELQWVAAVAIPMKINFLCSVGMVGWQACFGSSAKQACFISQEGNQVPVSLLVYGRWAGAQCPSPGPQHPFLTGLSYTESSLSEDDWNSSISFEISKITKYLQR